MTTPIALSLTASASRGRENRSNGTLAVACSSSVAYDDRDFLEEEHATANVPLLRFSLPRCGGGETQRDRCRHPSVPTCPFVKL